MCVGLLSIAPGPWALLIVMFAVGWFVMPVQATTMTIVQRATTNETRGRVAGALNAAIQTASIGSMAAAGILADVTGIRVVFAVGGAVALLAAVVAWFLFRGERDAVPTAVAGAAACRAAAGIRRRRPRGRRRSRGSAGRPGRSAAAPVPHRRVEAADHRPVVAVGLVRVHARRDAR